MNEVISLIWEWKFIILLTVVILLFCLLEWQRAKTILYALMLQAKRMAKDALLKSGKEQEEWVIAKAMQFLPYCIKAIASEKIVRVIVKLLFSKLKDYADDGMINNSI